MSSIDTIFFIYLLYSINLTIKIIASDTIEVMMILYCAHIIVIVFAKFLIIL